MSGVSISPISLQLTNGDLESGKRRAPAHFLVLLESLFEWQRTFRRTPHSIPQALSGLNSSEGVPLDDAAITRTYTINIHQGGVIQLTVT